MIPKALAAALKVLMMAGLGMPEVDDQPTAACRD